MKIFIKGEEVVSTLMWVQNIFLKILEKTSTFTFFYNEYKVKINKKSINNKVIKSLK
jgi:hypothetical protein